VLVSFATSLLYFLRDVSFVAFRNGIHPGAVAICAFLLYNYTVFISIKTKTNMGAEASKPNPEVVDANKKVEGGVATPPLDLGALDDVSGGSCGGGSCKIPEGYDPKKGNPHGNEVKDAGVEGSSGWQSVSLAKVDGVELGAVLLVGASWCAGCKAAKEELPRTVGDAKLYYLDYDEDPDQIEAKFSLNGSLPGKYKSLGGGQFKALT